MVNISLQPIFTDLIRSQVVSLSSDDLLNMWTVATKAGSFMPQGYRLENLSWRLWAKKQQEASCGNKTNQACIQVLAEVQEATPSTLICMPEVSRRSSRRSTSHSPSSGGQRKNRRNVESFMKRLPTIVTVVPPKQTISANSPRPSLPPSRPRSISSVTYTETSFISSTDIVIPLEPKVIHYESPDDDFMFQRFEPSPQPTESLITALFKKRSSNFVSNDNHHSSDFCPPERPGNPPPPEINAYPKTIPSLATKQRLHRRVSTLEVPLLDYTPMSVW